MLFFYTSKRSQNLAYDGLANLLTLALDYQFAGGGISHAHTLKVEVLYGSVVVNVNHCVVDTGGVEVNLEGAIAIGVIHGGTIACILIAGCISGIEELILAENRLGGEGDYTILKATIGRRILFTLFYKVVERTYHDVAIGVLITGI